MPALQTMLGRLNSLSLPDQIDDIPADLFSPGQELSDAVRALDPDLDDLAPYLDLLPIGIKEALRALIYSALVRETRQPMTFAWAPSYDYEMKLWDVSNTEQTAGGITVLLGSRYPSDRHPLAPS